MASERTYDWRSSPGDLITDDKFDVFGLLDYLFRTDQRSVRAFLIQQLYDVPLAQIDFVIPQLCALYVSFAPADREPLGKFLAHVCSHSMDIALRLVWFTQAERGHCVATQDDKDKQDPRRKRCTELIELCEVAVVNGDSTERVKQHMEAVKLRQQKEKEKTTASAEHVNAAAAGSSSANSCTTATPPSRSGERNAIAKRSKDAEDSDVKGDEENGANLNGRRASTGSVLLPDNDSTMQTAAVDPEVVMQLFLDKQQRSDFFNVQLHLVRTLEEISGRLTKHARDKRLVHLKEYLRHLTDYVAAGAYIPLAGSFADHYMIVDIPVDECVSLDSRDKAPFLFVLEVLYTGKRCGDWNIFQDYHEYHRLLEATESEEDDVGRDGISKTPIVREAVADQHKASSQTTTDVPVAIVAQDDTQPVDAPAPSAGTGLSLETHLQDQYFDEQNPPPSKVEVETLALAETFNPQQPWQGHGHAGDSSGDVEVETKGSPGLGPLKRSGSGGVFLAETVWVDMPRDGSPVMAVREDSPFYPSASSASHSHHSSRAQSRKNSLDGEDVSDAERAARQACIDAFGTSWQSRKARLKDASVALPTLTAAVARYAATGPSEQRPPNELAATDQPIATSQDPKTNSATSSASASASARLSPFRASRWDAVSVIFKGGDDLRQECLAMQLITLFHHVFQKAQLSLRLRPYHVMVTSPDSGIIETVPNAHSVHGLKKNTRGFSSLAKFFEMRYGGAASESYRVAVRNFTESMAAYSVVCYFLQIKDRHNGNILLDSEGHIVHIDFGFMLSNSPGGNLNWESTPFKLTREYVEVMGGEDSEAFGYFRMMVIRGFLEVRKHAQRFISLVEIMYRCGAPMACFLAGDSSITALRDRFMLTLGQEEVMERVMAFIDESIDNWRIVEYDNYQRITNGIL